MPNDVALAATKLRVKDVESNSCGMEISFGLNGAELKVLRFKETQLEVLVELFLFARAVARCQRSSGAVNEITLVHSGINVDLRPFLIFHTFGS